MSHILRQALDPDVPVTLSMSQWTAICTVLGRCKIFAPSYFLPEEVQAVLAFTAEFNQELLETQFKQVKL